MCFFTHKLHLVTYQVHNNLTATYQEQEACAHKTSTSSFMDGLQWECDHKPNPLFRCGVHRLDYTAALRCILQQIKLKTRLRCALKHPGSWSLWSFFFFLSYTSNNGDLRNHKNKYSNAVSHNRTQLLVMKTDRQHRLCAILYNPKQTWSLCVTIKAF